MERPLGLILTYALLHILLHSGVKAESETALLEIGLGNKKKIDLTNTKCVCDQNQQMTFQIPVDSLPDLSPGDFFASPQLAQKWRDDLDFSWSDNLFDCKGTLEQLTSQSGEKVLEITFTISRDCGVNLPNGKTPTFIVHKKRAATTKESTYYGRLMEGNLQFSYVSPSGEEKHLSAIIACECPETNPDYDCGADRLTTTHTETLFNTDIIDVKLDGQHSIVENCVKISHTNSTVTFDVDIPFETAQEDCNISVTDLGNFHEIPLDFNYLVDTEFNSQIFPMSRSFKKDYVCQQQTQWLEWSEWSKCSNSCQKSRVRLCDNGIAGLTGCENEAVQQSACDPQVCSPQNPCPPRTIHDAQYHQTLEKFTHYCKCDVNFGYQRHGVSVPASFFNIENISGELTAELYFVADIVTVQSHMASFYFDDVKKFQDLTEGVAFESKDHSYFFPRYLLPSDKNDFVAYCFDRSETLPKQIFKPDCKHIMSTLNQCEIDEPEDCEEICKADDPIEIKCSYDGKLITTLDVNYCGDCGKCNRITFSCKEGVKKVETESCGSCPSCNEGNLTTSWSDWSACSEKCDGGKTSRTRGIISESKIKNLDCDASAVNISAISTEESKTCNSKCCGYNENWTAWEPVRLNFVASEPECFEKRELEVKCTDPTKNNVTQIAYNDTCSDPFDVTNISELCQEGVDTQICAKRLDPLTNKESEFCATPDGWCCNSEPEELPSECTGKCSFEKLVLKQQNCAAIVFNNTNEDCRTDNNDFSCECAPSAVSNCVNVTDTCISDTNGNWRKVTKICGSDKNTCEVSEECSPEECVGNEHKNCYKKFDCKYENGYDCDQKSKEFYDAVGNVIQTKNQNCCKGLDDCTKDQVSRLCPPCNTAFPECMEDHELVICTDKKETCKNNPDQCQCGDFNCDEKSFELPDIRPEDLEKLNMGFPKELYGNELRFFIADNMTGYDTPGCFEKFDQSKNTSVLSIEKTYEIAKKCGAKSVESADGEETFEATIWVDKFRKNDSDVLTTATKFAKVSCLIPPPSVIDSGFIHAVPRYDPLQIVKISEAGVSDISFDLATDQNFRNILDPNNAQHLANAHLVGEKIYARIRGNQPIRLISCEIRSLDAIHEQLSETMIENGCPTTTMKTIFDMKYFGDRKASGNQEIKLSWQNFYFRKIASARQRVSYSCLVKPCFDSDCETVCPKSNRKRRSVDSENSIRQVESNRFNTSDSKFDFWIDVYKTVEELERAREIVAQWEHQRSVANVMSKCAIVTSAILVIFATMLAASMLRRRLLQARIRETEGGEGPKVLRMKKSQMDHQNNNTNIGVLNPTFSTA